MNDSVAMDRHNKFGIYEARWGKVKLLCSPTVPSGSCDSVALPRGAP